MTTFFPALLRSRSGLIGAVLLLVLILGALFAPYFGLASPVRPDLLARLAPPTWEGLFSPGAHPLGTDELGRDVLSRIVYGARVTLTIGICAVLVGAVIGLAIGIVAGYFGGWTDRVLMRLVDIQLAFPLVLFALLVVAALGPSLMNLIIVLGLTSWTNYARIVRGQVLGLREREFILSARAAGSGPMRTMVRHILPNVVTPALVVGTLELARVIVMDAALSFLGLGVQPPSPSWGRMLADGRTYINTAWWVVTFPGIAIALTVLSVNLMGDWLRDYFDPKLRR